MTEEIKSLSTSRLAEMAGIERKKMFALLKDNGWIERQDDKWTLTPQGEFHGGSYQYHEKYGEYIVWPKEVLEHEIITSYEEEWLSATRIAEKHHLAPRLVNLLFADLGWIEKDQRGWMLTDAGMNLGGQQRDGKQGFFVLWPGTILKHEDVARSLENLSGTQKMTCLDGHHCNSLGEQQIDNWLYLNHIAHACNRRLAGTDFVCSFYLPERQVYIDFWGLDTSTGSLSSKLEKEQWCKQHAIRHIEIGEDDLERLDEILRQQLLQYGLQLH